MAAQQPKRTMEVVFTKVTRHSGPTRVVLFGASLIAESLEVALEVLASMEMSGIMSHAAQNAHAKRCAEWFEKEK